MNKVLDEELRPWQEMVSQLEEEVNELRKFRTEFDFANPGELYQAIRRGWAFLLCKPGHWLEASVCLAENSVGQSFDWKEPGDLKAGWGHLMTAHQMQVVDQYDTGILVTHDNGCDVYPKLSSKRVGNLEALDLDYTARVSADLAELQRLRTEHRYLVSAVYRSDDMPDSVIPLKVCISNEALVQFIDRLAKAFNLGLELIKLNGVTDAQPTWIRISYANEFGDLAGEESDVSPEDLSDVLDDYLKVDGSIKQ